MRGTAAARCPHAPWCCRFDDGYCSQARLAGPALRAAPLAGRAEPPGRAARRPRRADAGAGARPDRGQAGRSTPTASRHPDLTQVSAQRLDAEVAGSRRRDPATPSACRRTSSPTPTAARTRGCARRCAAPASSARPRFMRICLPRHRSVRTRTRVGASGPSRRPRCCRCCAPAAKVSAARNRPAKEPAPMPRSFALAAALAALARRRRHRRGHPAANAARSCAPAKYPGPGLLQPRQVSHVSCATGKRVTLRALQLPHEARPQGLLPARPAATAARRSATRDLHRVQRARHLQARARARSSTTYQQFLD